MLFEDAQWADPTTLEAMDLLIHRLPNIPLLVVVTHRPDFLARWPRHDCVTSLTLTKLTRPESSAMVARLTGDKALPADLLEQIIAKTDGVPLFVEELIKSILESADLKDAGDRWEYAGHADRLAIPLTLRDLLLARLDRVTPVKEIAQIGAAIGREFGYELIAAVAPHAKPELDEALAQLTDSGLALQQGTPPAAVYTFKHALVQDAAYDSMLRRRRQELHDKIARVIEEQFPDIEAAEPEPLAHHYTEAKQPQKAIPLWQQAGNLALRHMALTEAVAHLNKGLGLVADLPSSADRDSKELGLRTLLGTAWIGLRGWPSREVWDALYPALGLANSLRRNDALVPTLFGLWANTFTMGRVAEALGWFTQTRDAAEAYGDPVLQILGHYTALVNYSYLGDLISARQHVDHLLALYAEERHGQLMGFIHQDPKTVGLAYSALLTWLFGYPAEAVQIRDAAEAHARALGHPFDLGWALTMGATVLDPLGRPDDVLKRTEEAEQLGRDNSLPVVTAFLVPCHSGVALIHKGQFAEGAAALKAGLSVWQASGGRTGLPYWKSVLAEGMAQLGDLGGALDLIDEVIAQIERPGWEERWCFAETLRIKGWLLSLKGDLLSAERTYVASLDFARRQQAKSWELRSSTSYARLMRDQGRVSEAHDLLAPVYGWFTEGFDTPDLREAKALLIELHN
jgi:predicted ATPase